MEVSKSVPLRDEEVVAEGNREDLPGGVGPVRGVQDRCHHVAKTQVESGGLRETAEN